MQKGYALRTTVAIATLLALAVRLHGDEPAAKSEAGPARTNRTFALRVVDVYLASSNEVYVGTNLVAATQLTNQLALYQGEVDAVAVHAGTNDARAAGLTSEMMGKLVHMGLPVLVVEESGSFARQPDDGETRTVTLNSDHLVAGLRRIKAIRDRPLPSLRAELGLDEEEGTRDLKKVELGFPERGIWLLHEADEEGRGMTGIQIKKSW